MPYLVLTLILACAKRAPAPILADPPGSEAEPAPALEAADDDAMIVKDTVKQYNGQLRYCYEAGLKANPSLGGRVELGWTIRDGAVVEVHTVSDTTGDAAFVDCLEARVASWRFPAGFAGEVSWPFVFRPSP